MERIPTIPIVLTASLLLTLHLVLAFALIPPWQQPDEPSHVALVELQRARIAGAGDVADPAREGEILQSMGRHDWWVHRIRPTPVEIPPRFGDAARLGGSVAAEVVGIDDPPAYFRIMGRVLSWLPRLTVTEDLYVLRAISALFGILTLWVAWLAARAMLPATAAATVALLLAVHPQFAIVSAAATPDAMTNFLGACLWWQAAAAIQRRRPYLRLLAMWALALSAAATDRMGVPLVAFALVASTFVLYGEISLNRGKAGVTATAAAAGAIGVLGVAAWAFDAFGESYGIRRVFSALVPVEGVMTWSSFVRFNWLLNRSWWYVLGWGRYGPPAWWATIAVVLTAAAALGVFRRMVGDREMDGRTRTLMALALAGVAVQLFAIYWAYFRLGNGAPGRYLFPVLVPSLVLLWAGLQAWIPRAQRLNAATALVLLLAFLDAVLWGVVAIPAYYASL